MILTSIIIFYYYSFFLWIYIFFYRCKQQVVSFVATTITEPDLFGPTGLSDLIKYLGIGIGGGTCDPILVFLMKELIDELITLNCFESVYIYYSYYYDYYYYYCFNILYRLLNK